MEESKQEFDDYMYDDFLIYKLYQQNSSYNNTYCREVVSRLSCHRSHSVHHI